MFIFKSFSSKFFLLFVGNVVWDDEFTASRVLMAVGKQLENPTGEFSNVFTQRNSFPIKFYAL